jgi:hypothetical protein
MAITWFLEDKVTPITFPYSLGNFITNGEAPNKLLYLYTDVYSISNASLSIQQSLDTAYKAWRISKDIFGRPMLFTDYLTPLSWSNLIARTWYPIWIKFLPEIATGNPNDINLVLKGELNS